MLSSIPSDLPLHWPTPSHPQRYNVPPRAEDSGVVIVQEEEEEEEEEGKKAAE